MTADYDVGSDDGVNSDVLWPAIEAAIQQVLVAHGGGMIDSFLGMVEYVSSDGSHRFSTMSNPDQLQIRSLGMAQHMHAWELEIQRLNMHEQLITMGDDGDQYNED